MFLYRLRHLVVFTSLNLLFAFTHVHLDREKLIEAVVYIYKLLVRSVGLYI